MGRTYDSTLRQQRASQTRERIIEAGCELLRASSIRDWQGLTVRAVAERAGVHERTIYRHFANERGFRDAVMRRLEEQAGIDLTELELGDVADVARRIFAAVSAHPPEPRPPLDPTLSEASERTRQALLRALEPHTAGWSDDDRRVAAAMLDVFWGVATYERLAVDWHLAHDDATRGVTWLIDLIVDAVQSDRRP